MDKHTKGDWYLYEDGENGICLNGGVDGSIIIAEQINDGDRNLLLASKDLLETLTKCPNLPYNSSNKADLLVFIKAFNEWKTKAIIITRKAQGVEA